MSNFVEMAKKGVTMTNLVKSKIFNYTFDFDQWPGTNVNTERMIVPYNQSIFKLRQHYQNLFPALYEADEQRKLEKEKISLRKIPSLRSIKGSLGANLKKMKNLG